jgi:hypothetical protein
MTQIEARSRAARSRSRMMHGGWSAAVPFSGSERAACDALVDALIPPEDGWPGSADLGVADTIGVYLVPDAEPLSFYPHYRRAEFTGLVGELTDGRDTTAALTAYETRDPREFGRLRDFVYYAYYGSPAVVRTLRERSTYGRTYQGAPQPTGYPDTEHWTALRPSTARGAFVPTSAVRPVDGGAR